MSTSPTNDAGPGRSPSTITPSVTATSGLTYVITLSRLGPASAISRKNTTSPSAVHTTPRTAIQPSASSGGAPSGGAITAAGVSATAAAPSATATGPIGSSVDSRRSMMIGAVA